MSIFPGHSQSPQAAEGSPRQFAQHARVIDYENGPAGTPAVSQHDRQTIRLEFPWGVGDHGMR